MKRMNLFVPVAAIVLLFATNAFAQRGPGMMWRGQRWLGTGNTI